MMVDSTPSVGPGQLPRPAVPKSDVGFLDALGPAVRSVNIVGSTLQAAKGPTASEIFLSEKVNPWTQIEGTDYEPYFENFVGSESMAEVDFIKQQIDRETADRRTISEAGLGGIAALMLAGVVDLPSLVPVGAAFQGIRGGVTAARVAGRTAAVAGAEATVVEGILQSQQQTLTAFESATAIGGSFILGGILGGGAGAVLSRTANGKQAFKVASQEIDRQIASGAPLAAGADVRMKPELTDFNLPTSASQVVRNNTPGGLSYTDRIGKAQSPAARQHGNDLIANEYAFEGTDKLAMQPSVEAIVKVEVDKYKAIIARTFRDDWKDHAKSKGDLSKTEFSERVAAAMRRGDEDPQYPAVSRTAQRLRESVVEPLKDQAVRLGKLPEDVNVSTAASYFTRMWDQNRIIARSDEFLDRLAKDIGRGENLSAEDMAYARIMAEDVYHTLTNADTPLDTLQITAKARGPLKERTLNVADVDYEDFLENDAELVLNRYSQIMSAENELTQRFGRADMQDQIREIRDDYAKLRDAAKTEKKRTALDTEMKRVIKSLEAARDMVRGTYLAKARAGGVYRTMQGAMAVNYVRALGDVVLSSLPDVFKITMSNGIMPVARDALVPMMGNLKQFRVAQRKAGEVAGIAETLLNSRIMQIADITDPYATRTPVEKFLNTMSSKASVFSGMMHWNQFLKETSAYLAQNRMARMMTKDLSQTDQRFLKRLKINSRDWDKITGQMESHGSWLDKNIYDPGTENWSPEIRKLYAAALRAEADTTIVTPGIGDKVPLVEENWGLKPAQQFKSFALASHRKTLLVGLQEDQARFMQSALLMTSMGMFVYWLKSMQYKDGPSDNPGTWLAEGIDRTGIIPLYMEANNIWEKLGGPGAYWAAAQPFGGSKEKATRYQVRSMADSLAGPTAGLVNDTAVTTSALLGAMFGNDITPGDVGSARRLVPFGRHPGIKQFLDMWAVPNLKDSVR